ncbi:MAG: sensor histidine kinase, partial [Streptomycetaceae bacterium]|nr:sensor histidine kinase [Streptomycetaceae bacterium]
MPGLRTLKARIIVLVLVPSIALVAVWTTYTVGRYQQAEDLRRTLDDVQRVAVKGELAMVSMQEERRLSMEFLAGNGADRSRLDGQRHATDQAVAVMGQAASSVVAHQSADLKRIFAQISTGLNALPGFRQQVDARQVPADAAFQFYSGALDVAMSYFEAEVRVTNDTKTATEAATAAALFRALEYFARQNAVLSAALASPTGFTPAQRAQFDQLVGTQRAQYGFVQPQLRDAQAARYAQIAAGPERAVLTTAENTASARTGKVAVDAAWQPAMASVAGQLQQLTLDQVEFARGYGKDRVDDLTTSVIVVGAVTLASIALAVLISVLVSRALIRRLRGLRDSTRRLATEQLPGVVARLQRGEKVDPGEASVDFHHGRDEIGEVASAFEAAQRIAVQAAIEQAETRQGISRVFLNLAHRSQGLVHRQLALLDTMERAHEDPDLLAELFQADHLATRMRRNAENLSVLGGSMPARRWRRPVQLAEVLRGAASQTEDYSRVKLTMIPEASLAGPVAGDVMHLLSELVENATTFSPPHTKVRINAEVVPNGLGIEIEDRGLGMSEQAREEANRLLATAPEFNVMGFTQDSRIGLFVVARLAHRHGIAVSVRSSPYGGTSAVVLLPPGLLGDPVRDDAGHDTGHDSAPVVGRDPRYDRHDSRHDSRHEDGMHDSAVRDGAIREGTVRDGTLRAAAVQLAAAEPPPGFAARPPAPPTPRAPIAALPDRTAPAGPPEQTGRYQP